MERASRKARAVGKASPWPRMIPASLFLIFSSALSAAPLAVYTDQLQSGFADWSWAAHDLAQTAVVHSGGKAISFQPSGYGGLYLERDAGIDLSVYGTLDFWIHGGAVGGQNVRVAALVANKSVGDAPLTNFIAGGKIPANQWVEVHVPFASLGVSSGVLSGFWLADGSGGTQAAVYVDDVQISERSTLPALAVYTDQLQNGFADWSWAVHSLSQTSVVHAGSAAISFEPSGYGGLYFERDAGIVLST